MDRSDTAGKFSAGRSYARAASSFASAAAAQFAVAGSAARAQRAAELALELERLGRPELDATAAPDEPAARTA